MAQLSTYATRALTKIAGVDASGNVGLTTNIYTDTSGRISFGTVPIAGFGYLQLAGITAEASTFGIARFTNDALGPITGVLKSRGATVGSFTVVQSGDQLGTFAFAGADGTQERVAAQIEGYVDGTPGSADMPGRMVFSVTLDGASVPTTRMTLDNAGRLGVGTVAPIAGFGNLQVGGTTGEGSQIATARFTADAFGPTYAFLKSRGTSVGSFTAVSSGDQAGIIAFAAADGTTSRTLATIEAYVDGTPGASDMPGRLVWSTTLDGTIVPVEHMRMDNVGMMIYSPGSVTPATLATNGQYTFTPTSNTNFRISYRGTDGTTRVNNITLA